MRGNPSHALIARVGVGASPIGLAMVRDGSRILVADSNFNGTGNGGRSRPSTSPACPEAYCSRSRRSRSRTSPGLSVATRIMARIASASGTRGTSSSTAAASAHWVS